MTLGEKILELRAARGLSQGDLAEQLEVSRQSVSKWETGQSVPDLDKLIKLADLFGVTVDELVRDGERPQPTQPEPQVIYVERRPRLTAAQVVGVVLEVTGVLMFLSGLLGLGALLSLLGVSAILAGLPLLLAKKHPWLIAGWLLIGGSYLIFNVFTTRASLLGPLALYVLFTQGIITTGGLIAIIRMAAGLALTAATLRVWRLGRRTKAKD